MYQHRTWALAFDEWATEGERLFDSFEQRLRRGRDLVEERVEEGAATIADVGRGIAETVTEPIIGVEAINGIGPSYASRLAKAGVVSTAALLERSRTRDALTRLASQTGISESLLTRWAADADLTRIDGIGSDSMEFLQILGIGTVGVLADADAAELHRLAAALRDRSPRINSAPSEATLTAWIEKARSLDA